MALKLRRLKHRSDFLRIARSNEHHSTDGLVLQVGKQVEYGGDLRGSLVGIGFTVSRKVGNAVKRNRVRRRLKALAEEVFPNLAEPGCDYVIIGRKNAITRCYNNLRQDIRLALRRSKAKHDFGGSGR